MNAILYMDNKTIDFNTNININMSKSTTIEIKFLGNLTTFKEMFKGCNKLNQVTLNNIVTGNETETSSMFEGCTYLT